MIEKRRGKRKEEAVEGGWKEVDEKQTAK